MSSILSHLFKNNLHKINYPHGTIITLYIIITARLSPSVFIFVNFPNNPLRKQNRTSQIIYVASRVPLRRKPQFAHTCASAVGIAAIILSCAPINGGKGGRVAKTHGKSQARLAEIFVNPLKYFTAQAKSHFSYPTKPLCAFAGTLCAALSAAVRNNSRLGHRSRFALCARSSRFGTDSALCCPMKCLARPNLRTLSPERGE